MKILIYWENYKISISSNFMTCLVGVILVGFFCALFCSFLLLFWVWAWFLLVCFCMT